jgi:hypothetical protein
VLAARPIRRVLQAHLAVARVAGAATHVDAHLAAGQDDEGQLRTGHGMRLPLPVRADAAGVDVGVEI